MSLRRILLVVLFGMLGLAGLLCAGAIMMSSGSRGLEFSAIVGFETLIAGVAVSPLVWLIGKPRFRLASVVGSGVVIWGWMLAVGLAGMEMSYGYMSYNYRVTGAVAVGLGMTALMGIPTTVALLLVSFRWARVAVWGFVGFAGCGYALAMLGAGLMAGDRQLGEAFLLSGMILYGIGVAISLLLLNAGCGDRRLYRWPGVGLGMLAIGFSWGLVWVSDYMRVTGVEKFLAVALVLTLLPMVTLAHTNLAMMAQMRRVLDWVKYVVVVGGWFVGLTITLGSVAMIVFEPRWEVERVAMNIFGVMLVLLALASLGLLLLAVFNRRSEMAPPPPPHEFTKVALTCPRCGSLEVVGTGDGACGACRLRIQIVIIEPRCPTCGYNLYRITAERCPECGTAVNGGGEVGAGAKEAAEVDSAGLGGERAGGAVSVGGSG